MTIAAQPFNQSFIATLFLEWLMTQKGQEHFRRVVSLSKEELEEHARRANAACEDGPLLPISPPGGRSVSSSEEAEFSLETSEVQYVRASEDALFPVREKPRATASVCEGLPEMFTREELSLWLVIRMGLSPYLAAPVTQRLEGSRARLESALEKYSENDRLGLFYSLVASDASRGISRDDLRFFVRAVLQEHPALGFFRMQGTRSCQAQYVETVVVRIFHVCRAHSEFPTLTLRWLRRLASASASGSGSGSGVCLAELWRRLEEERGVFSYEQFYVLFYLFWEMDADKDGMLEVADVLGYEGLSDTFVKKCLFRGRAKLQYAEFVEFVLCFQDLQRTGSLEQICRLLDLSDDGKLRKRDLLDMYNDHGERAPAVKFQDLLHQFWETLNPCRPGETATSSGDWHICWRELLEPSRRGLAGVFLAAVISRDRLLSFEQRDPYSERQERLASPHWSEWDRFAHKEYCRIVHSHGSTATATATATATEASASHSA